MNRHHWTRGLTPSSLYLLVLLVLAGCSESGFDKARHDQIQRAIASSPSNMLGMGFSDASKLLKLDGVKWDRGYDNLPLGEWRIYHFDGFYLALHLSVRPQGVRLGEGFSVTNDTELRSNGVWWVDAWEPRLEIDRLTDPKQRMSNHWARVEKGFQMRGRVAAELWGTNGGR